MFAKINKTKIAATLLASVAVFMVTYFAVASDKNTSTIFLDSDQDSLTDQEEKMIGPDPKKTDTDGDGYSDGKEVASGYNPLKPAPGDRLFPNAEPSGAAAPPTTLTGSSSSQDLAASDSDPDDPNLTNEMVDRLLKLTVDKSTESEDFLENPDFTSDDLSQITQAALTSADISSQMPEISEADMQVLPAVDDKELKPEELKEKQKQEIEKYLSSLAYIFAANSPFPVENPESLSSRIQLEGDNLLSAIAGGNSETVETYAKKCSAAIDQIKQLEVPYVMKDTHKSALQLALYILSFKDKVVASQDDPMKSLAAISSLQTTGESILKLQSQLQSVLDEYGIKGIEIKQ